MLQPQEDASPLLTAAPEQPGGPHISSSPAPPAVTIRSASPRPTSFGTKSGRIANFKLTLELWKSKAKTWVGTFCSERYRFSAHALLAAAVTLVNRNDEVTIYVFYEQPSSLG